MPRNITPGLPNEFQPVKVRVTGIDTPETGGRINANVTIDGRSLGATLIKAGLARAYDGGKRRGYSHPSPPPEGRGSLSEVVKSNAT